LDCIRRQTPWLNPGMTEGQFHRMTLGPGEYYPRIARPLALAIGPALWSPPVEEEKGYIASARSQLVLLTRKLETVCRTIQPSEKNLDAYGHEIRNLLILAATEVEMHWRGILTANRSATSQFNSDEYVKLVEPLKLTDYAIEFREIPDLVPIRPFAGWSNQSPTKSLEWFDAYHGVKHNREIEFKRGTLRHAFEVVSACIALLVAQFGPAAALSAELSSLVGLTLPNWALGEMYFHRMGSTEWTPVHCPELKVVS